MFADCHALTTIYVSKTNKFEFGQPSANYDWDDMFINCNNLKGGAGTVWTSSNTDYEYAIIDKGSSTPGYFTGK